MRMLAGGACCLNAADEIQHLRLVARNRKRKVGCRTRATGDRPAVPSRHGKSRLAHRNALVINSVAAVRDSQRADVFLDDAGRRHVLLDERGARGSAAECLQAQAPVPANRSMACRPVHRC